MCASLEENNETDDIHHIFTSYAHNYIIFMHIKV